MKCLHCDHLDLQAKKDFSKLGMGRCPSDPSGTFVSVSFDRFCKKFKPAPADTVAKRETWVKKL